MIDLNKLAAEIHEAAVKKGFWDIEDAEEKHLAKMISELGEVVQADRAGVMYEIECEGAKPEGVVAELGDFVMMALDLYKQYDADFSIIETACEDYKGMKDVMEGTPVYCLAMICANDVVDLAVKSVGSALVGTIYTVTAWAETHGFDLWEIIRQKMAYNESRPALHGRKY